MRVLLTTAVALGSGGLAELTFADITDTFGDCAQCLNNGGTLDCLDECDIIGNVDDAVNDCCTWWACSSCPEDTPATTTTTAALPCDSDSDCPEQQWCFVSTGTCATPTAYSCVGGNCGMGDGGCVSGQCTSGYYCAMDVDSCSDFHDYVPGDSTHCCVPEAPPTPPPDYTPPPSCTYDFQGFACMDANGNVFSDTSYFESSFSGTISGVYLEYEGGSVDCNSKGDGGTNWGCELENDYLSTFIVDGDKNILYPANGTYTHLTQTGWDSDAWYLADDELGWSPDASALYFPGEMEVEAGQGFYLVYGEALFDFTTSDNAGTTCASISWVYGDCGGTDEVVAAIKGTQSTKAASVKS